MALRRPVNKVERAFSEMSRGALHSGSPTGPVVSNPKQAIAIGIHEQQAATGSAPLRRTIRLPKI